MSPKPSARLPTAHSAISQARAEPILKFLHSHIYGTDSIDRKDPKGRRSRIFAASLPSYSAIMNVGFLRIDKILQEQAVLPPRPPLFVIPCDAHSLVS
jgi:hypothetical protein